MDLLANPRNGFLVAFCLGGWMANPVCAKDTTLVTQISYQDTSNQVLRTVTNSWDWLESGWLRQRQFEGQGTTGLQLLEQIYDDQGHALRVDVLDSAKHIVRRSDLTYDGAGRLVLLILQDASAPTSLKRQIITYGLRSDGQVQTVRATDSAGNILSLLTNTYSTDNRIETAIEKRNDTTFQSVQHHWSSDGMIDTLLTLAGGKDSAEVRIKEFNASNQIVREFVSLRLSNKSWFIRETRSTYDTEKRLIREDNYDGNHLPIGHIVYTQQRISLNPVSISNPSSMARPSTTWARRHAMGKAMKEMGLVKWGPWFLGRQPSP